MLFRWSEALQFEALAAEEQLESTYLIGLLLPRKIEARCSSDICTSLSGYMLSWKRPSSAIEIYILSTLESINFLSQNVM